MVVFYAINGYSAIHKLNFRTDDKVLPKSYTQVQISLIICWRKKSDDIEK